MIKKHFFLVFFIISNIIVIPSKSDEIFELGKDIFVNKAVCSTCHILNDAGSDGQIGPNLNVIRPNKMTVINVVTNGIGVMPGYEDQLTKE